MSSEIRDLLSWTVLGFLAVLVISSFTGYGTGFMGWGLMVGMIWLWLLVPVLVLVVLVLVHLESDRRSSSGAQAPRSEGRA